MSFNNPIVLDDDDISNNNNNNNPFSGMRASDGTILYPAFSLNQHVVVQVGAQFLHATVEAIELKSTPVITTNTSSSSSSLNSSFNSSFGNLNASQQQQHQQHTFYYYVHFADQDRRMDLWVEADVLRNATNNGLRNSSRLSAAAAAKVGKQTATRTRRQLQMLEQQQQQQQGGGGSSNNNLATNNSSANSSRAQSVTTTTNNNNNDSVNSSSHHSHHHHHYQPTTAKNYARSHQHSNADSKFFDRPKNVAKFVIGDVEVDSWYFSPYLLAHPKVRRAIAEEYNVFRTVPDDVDLFTSIGSSSNSQDQNLNNNNNKYNGSTTNKNNFNLSQQQKQQQSSSSAAMITARDFVLHLCPYCLEPELDHASIVFHLISCLRRPPGREVYRDPSNKLIVFECDGAIHSHFAKNLALVSKAFLEHKSLDYDMTPFVFYVVCTYEEFSSSAGHDDDEHENDDDDDADAPTTSPGCRITSYFSREKQNSNNYNLSCILTLPQFQSKGYGRFMIDMSYEMSRREGKSGTPEKPLSDFGERVYRAVWKERVLDVLANWTPVMENIQYLPHLARQYGLLTGKQMQQQNNNSSSSSSSALVSAAAGTTGQSASTLATTSLANTSSNILAAFNAAGGGSGAGGNNNNSSFNPNTSMLTLSSSISIDSLMYATGMIKQDVTQALQDLKVMDFMRNYSSSSNNSNNSNSYYSSSTSSSAKENNNNSNNSSSGTFRVINIDPEVLKNHLKAKIRRQERGDTIFEPALFHWFPQWYASNKGYNDAVTTLNGGSRFSAFAAALPSNQNFREAEEIILTSNSNNADDSCVSATKNSTRQKVKIERDSSSTTTTTTNKKKNNSKSAKKEAVSGGTKKKGTSDKQSSSSSTKQTKKNQTSSRSQKSKNNNNKQHHETQRRKRE